MSDVTPTYSDEIDLFSLIQTIWDGKWVIASTVAVSILLVFGFNVIKPNTKFTAKTYIKPITSFEFDRYSLFNESLKIIEKNGKDDKNDKSFNIFEITQRSLLNLYIEQMEEGTLLESGIDKFNLINKEDFDSENDYKDAIAKFASKIEVLKPIKQKDEENLNHVLKAEYNDKNKWKKLLTFVDEEANKNVEATIINRFATIVSIQNQKKKFALADLDVMIDNVKKDYERNTKDRIAFLAEQAAIARKLDIKKITVASQRFSPQNTFITNVKTDIPFYLRGYLAIDEEIKQIKNRKNKNAFTNDLYNLQQQKREIKQDKTIKRALELFKDTPLNQNEFKASMMKVATTDFQTNNKKLFYYVLASIFGGIVGVIYVLITNTIRNSKVTQ